MLLLRRLSVKYRGRSLAIHKNAESFPTQVYFLMVRLHEVVTSGQCRKAYHTEIQGAIPRLILTNHL